MFEVRAIRESEREECLALWITVWPGENSERYFRRYFYGDVEWLPYYTQVGVLDGKIVSAVNICRRVVACGEYSLTMGGIANVSTLPEYRGQGYNTQCLKQALRVMEADALDFSLLGTGINGYYERLGYATWPLPRVTGSIRAERLDLPDELTVRPARETDLAAIQAIYAEYNRARPIAVRRDSIYWREWVGLTAVDRADYSVAIFRGEPVGYIKIDPIVDSAGEAAPPAGINLIEFAVGDNAPPETTAALLTFLAELGRTSDKRFVQCEFTGDSDFIAAMNQVFAEVRTWHSHGDMVRLLHRENLMRGFAPLWNERWVASGRPRGVLIFETPYGPMKIDANGPLLNIGPIEEMSGAMSQSSFFGLLFGTLKSQAASDRPGEWPLIQALFLTQPGVYYAQDGF